MPAAPKESPVRSTAPVAVATEADANSTASPAAGNPAAAAGPASAKRPPALPKPQPTHAPMKSDPKPGATESASPGVGEEPAAPSSPRPGAGDAPQPGRLVRALRVRISAWTPRLVQDAILPTQPVRDGEDDSVDLLRERLLKERGERMPQTLKHPVVQFGFRLEIPASRDGLQPRWRDQAGREPSEANVSGQTAEIAWSGGPAPDHGEYVLGYPGGREIARITTDAQGGVVLEAAKDVSCRYWVAVERAAAEGTGLPATQGASRFEWRLLDGSNLPVSWVRDDHWQGGSAQRLDLPVGARGSGARTDSLAFVDRITGWAIVGEVSQADD